MTIGRKIQFYRNRLELSQEELAQKINVSPETISLWETDAVSPAIDDLVALKDVFGVTVDEIVSSAEPAPASETPIETPIESYEFRYTETEIEAVYGKILSPILKSIIALSALLVMCIWFTLINKSLLTLILAILCVVWIVKRAKIYSQYKKAEKISESRVGGSVYRYDTYYEYFRLHVERRDGNTEDIKVYYNEIRYTADLGEFLALATETQNFIIKKAEIHPNSGFYFISPNPKNQNERQKPVGKQRVISITLFVCSIATLWGALIGVAALAAFNYMTVENMWVFFLFTPVPIASIIFALRLKKSGFKYKFNLIVGIVMVIILCLYGSFTFAFANVFSHSDEVIVKVENTLGIDIPEHKRINTQDWTQGTQSGMRGYIYSVSDVFFTDEAVEAFENSLPSNPKWLSSVPSDMIGISSPYYDVEGFDYGIIYNVDTGEFNSLPDAPRSYRFINVLYDCERNTMAIVEYEIEYKK